MTRRVTRPPHPSRLPATLFLIPVLTACFSLGTRGDAGGIEHNGEGIVLSGVALTDGQGSVLDVMRGKVPNFSVNYTQGDCPKISFRNDAGFRSVVNPRVYVDGTRTGDTCILESLRSGDVLRIEVYPRGVSHRPGYGFHPHGLILIFMRS